MKENLNKFLRLFMCGLFLAAWCAIVPTHAQEADDEEYEDDDEESLLDEVDWEVRKKEIENFYNGKVAEHQSLLEKQINDLYTVEFIKAQIRRRMNNARMGDFRILRIPGIEVDWTNYNQAPPKDKDTIVDEVRERAREHANEKIRPEERKQAIIDSADERFRMVQINERVTLMLRNGRGAAAVIEDQPLRGVNDERVQLGNRFIIREDISEEDQALFYPDVNSRVKEAYIVNGLGKIEVEVESMIAQECYDKTAPEFLANNYVPDILKSNANLRTAKPDLWVAKKDFVARIRKELIRIGVELFKTQEMPKIMADQGYIYVQTEDKKGMEWIDQAEKLRRDAVSAVTPSDENGMGMGMGPEPGMIGPPPRMR